MGRHLEVSRKATPSYRGQPNSHFPFSLMSNIQHLLHIQGIRTHARTKPSTISQEPPHPSYTANRGRHQAGKYEFTVDIHANSFFFDSVRVYVQKRRTPDQTSAGKRDHNCIWCVNIHPSIGGKTSLWKRWKREHLQPLDFWRHPPSTASAIATNVVSNRLFRGWILYI